MKTKNGNVKFILNLALEPKLWFIIFIPVLAIILEQKEFVSSWLSDDKEMNTIFKSLSLDKVLEKNNATFDTDLTRNFDENGIMLSGGEKQKLAVARLMTKKFGLLIFDEPTAALDPIAEAELNRMILDKANTSTTILISHRLSNVVNADYIYVVRNGEIAECGTHESLMAEKGFYYRMFELQAENYK